MSLGNMDLMIAAHAIATGSILVTNNNAFGQLEDLNESVNSATDLTTDL
jgi:predicted nucleic acid-binding protein